MGRIYRFLRLVFFCIYLVGRNKKTAPLKAELSNTGKPGFILFLCLCGFLSFSLVLAVEPAELIHCKRAEERCDDGDEDERSDSHGRGEDKSDNADHYREDGNLPVLREVGRGERAEERGQNLLESGSDVGVGGQRGEHRTEREHADCEDYSSRDSRGRDSDSRDDFALLGVCAHACILHGVESAGQLEVRNIAGDEAQICSACAEHGSIGEHFGDAGDPVDRDNDLHCIEELARLGPRIVVRAYRDGHEHEGCNGGYRRNSAPDMYFFAVGLSVLFTHLHFPPYQPLHSR